MPDRSWKAWERRLASWFPNASRRGAYTGSRSNGKSDLICAGWSVEAKLLSRPSFQVLLDACYQAEENQDHPGDIPVAVIKRKGDRDTDALVIMRLETFKEYFINDGATGALADLHRTQKTKELNYDKQY
jgi:hypothetical protein